MPQRQLDYKAEAAKLLQAYETPKDYEFITQDDDCLCMLKQADKLAHRPESVLITGESGKGKVLVARRIHGRRSGR